ncbi:hypothetical protein HOC01_01085 [archaeon]|jgi:hypothetical protein|nr:hypothetical protein [archaeon]MBT6698563.1 hypothetical protein [archaeon]
MVRQIISGLDYSAAARLANTAYSSLLNPDGRPIHIDAWRKKGELPDGIPHHTDIWRVGYALSKADWRVGDRTGTFSINRECSPGSYGTHFWIGIRAAVKLDNGKTVYRQLPTDMDALRPFARVASHNLSRLQWTKGRI